MPTPSPMLEELKGLRFRNKIGAAFSCYGWSGGAAGLVEEHLDGCKIPVAAEGVRVMWQPKAEDLARCEELRRTVARAMKSG